MPTLSLAELTPETVEAAVKLRLAPGQERFVAPVAQSLAEAYVTPTAWPRVVLDGDEVVGFVMGNFDPDNEVAAFRAGIWRLNVSADAQGRGVGRFAVEQLEAEAARRGVETITVMWEPGDGGPEDFYRRLGFEPTGEELFGEIVGAKVVAVEPAGAATPEPAAAEPVTRVVVQDALLPHPLSIVRVETRRISIRPNVAAGLHVHNGPVIGSIETGSAIYQVDGEPEKTLRPGDVFYEPAGARVARFDGGPHGVTFVAHFPLEADQEATLVFPDEEPDERPDEQPQKGSV
ncbi:GNAT family N-acetyltransferase [Leifsonia sp. NPDC058292]|uniref:GNAT family N-acetyltransferase n=1 Tax=Leifsonia sp. NPDC058292 TaxID=3346428 RepID=UPI0036DF18BE